MGAIRVVVLAVTERADLDRGDWSRQFLLWVVAPSGGLTLVAWLMWWIRRPGRWDRFDGS